MCRTGAGDDHVTVSRLNPRPFLVRSELRQGSAGSPLRRVVQVCTRDADSAELNAFALLAVQTARGPMPGPSVTVVGRAAEEGGQQRGGGGAVQGYGRRRGVQLHRVQPQRRRPLLQRRRPCGLLRTQRAPGPPLAADFICLILFHFILMAAAALAAGEAAAGACGAPPPSPPVSTVSAQRPRRQLAPRQHHCSQEAFPVRGGRAPPSAQ